MPRRASGVRRFLKICAILAVVMIGVVLAVPAILSMDWARARIESQASEALGTEFRVGSYSFGWFSGLEVEDVSISNPPGFPSEQKLFEAKSLRGDASVMDLLRGRFAVTGTVAGLALRVYQRRDGTTNLGELRGVRSGEAGTGDGSRTRTPGSGDKSKALDLVDVRIDIQLRDALIEVVHEDHGVLERLEHVTATIGKEYGTNVVRFDFGCDLARPSGGAPGRLELRVDAHADTDQPIDARVRAVDLDLSRYRPVLATFFPADQVTAFAGIVTANAQVTGKPKELLTVEGNVDIVEPHFAGPLFGGADLGAPRWTLKPQMSIGMPTDGTPLRLDLSQFVADLGFLTMKGLPTQPVGAAGAGGVERAGVAFDIDVAALAARGGTLPAMLKDSGTRVKGEARMPLASDLAGAGLQQIVSMLGLEAQLDVRTMQIGGQTLGGLVAGVSLAGGRLEILAKSGTYGGGPLQLKLVADATKLDTLPLEVGFGVDGAKVVGESIAALQYVFPLAAGLATATSAGSPVGLDATMGLRLDFAGPGVAGAGQELLAWLDQWSGTGRIGMKDGTLRPAAALSELLRLTGDAGELHFANFSNEFRLKDGFVEGGQAKLSAKGKDFGLTGRTSLAGALDWILDVKPLLADHKDGQQILKYLGDAPIGAALNGTLATPSLAMPKLDEIIQQALQKAIEGGASDLLKKEAGNLLDSILGGKKKEGGTDAVQDGLKSVLDGVLAPKPGTKKEEQAAGAPPGAPDAPIDAARSVLEQILQQQQPGQPGAAAPAPGTAPQTGPTKPRPDPIGDMLRQLQERQRQQQTPPPNPPNPPIRRDG